MADDAQLHVVFNPSLAGSLRVALAETGRKGQVVSTFDDLSFGPIASDDRDDRLRWIEEQFGWTDWGDIIDCGRTLLDASLSAGPPPIVWASFDTAHSHAGFLWWLSLIGQREFRVIFGPHLSGRNSEMLAGFFGREAPLSESRKTELRSRWRQLQAENAPLRVIEGEKPVSALIDHFDSALLKHATHEWRKMALIVGSHLADQANAGVYQSGDLILFSRLFALVDAGLLEWREVPSPTIYGEVRLPTANQTAG